MSGMLLKALLMAALCLANVAGASDNAEQTSPLINDALVVLRQIQKHSSTSLLLAGETLDLGLKESRFLRGK